ncbi:MAG: MFS transporter [candidate division WOR-3 bacterium]
MERKGEFLNLFKIRNFLIFAFSQAFSLFGDKLDYMALLALIAFLSQKYNWDTARGISYLSVAITLPTILFGNFAGVLVDRWDKRKVLVICDLIRAFLVLLIPLVVLEVGSLFLVYLIAFLIFLFGLFFNTARLAVIPTLVSPRRLLAANSFISLIGRIATFLGVLLGGVIVDLEFWRKIGIRYPWSAGFYIDSFSYWVSAFSLIYIFRRYLLIREKKKESLFLKGKNLLAMAGSNIEKLFLNLKETYKLIFSFPPVTFTFLSVLTFVLLGAGVFVLYIPIVQTLPPPNLRIGKELGLGLGTRGVGFLGAVGSIGLIISSLSYGILGHKISKRIIVVICLFFLGVIAILSSLTRSVFLPFLFFFLGGIFLSPILIAWDTILQESVPKEIRGRIFSTREWILHFFFGLFAFIFGQLTTFFAKRDLLLVVGLIVIFFCFLLLPLLKKPSGEIQKG